MLANIFIILANLITLAIVLLIGEYEVAKIQKPEASWLPTPTALDLSLVSTIMLMSVINIAVTIFVMRRQLDHHRRWLWWTTALSVALVLIIAAVLGPRFLPILWPTFS